MNWSATALPENAARPPRLPLSRAAGGHDRLQAARIDRIDGGVGADRRVDRGAQLDLIVGAAALHAGAEIDDRLLLLNRRERLGQRLQRAQPDVVVEGVELLRAWIGRRRIVGRGLCRASSVAAVLASTGANAVPSLAAKADSTERIRSLLLVKSVSTCSAS